MASISPEGGMLLELNLGGMRLISSEKLADPRQIYMGTTLAPWPNRLADGNYELAGKSYQFGNLDAQHNLNHGLLASQKMIEVERPEGKEGELLLGYSFGDNPEYPFEVELTVHFEITDRCLEVTAIACNEGAESAPFAIGFHPYFLVGQAFELDANFTHHLAVDGRMLPTHVEPVAGLQYAGGPIDDCYFGANSVFVRTSEGAFEVELGENMTHFMFFRPAPDIGESLLAIEPMSAPANVFRDDIASVLLAPGENKRYSYRIRTR